MTEYEELKGEEMREVKIIEGSKGIEVAEQVGDKRRGVVLTEGMDTLDYHLAQYTIKVFSEMITRHQKR